MSYLRRRRLLRDLTARDIDEMRRWHDEAELDRHDREQMEREPRDDRPARGSGLSRAEDFRGGGRDG